VRTRLKTLAKDHLQQAYYILQADEAFADVQRLITRTLDVMERDGDRDLTAGPPPANVLRFRPIERPISLPPGVLVTRRRSGAAEG